MHPLLELASRVEAATGPSPALDTEIKALMGHSWDYAADWGPRGNDAPVAYPYTKSLDAAMTLKPSGEGHWPQIIYIGTNPNNPAKQRERCEIWVKGHAKPFRANAATLPLALAAASLRAIAAQQEQNDG